MSEQVSGCALREGRLHDRSLVLFSPLVRHLVLQHTLSQLSVLSVQGNSAKSQMCMHMGSFCWSC